MIIGRLIDRIEIGKGYDITIKMNMNYEQFVGWRQKKKQVLWWICFLLKKLFNEKENTFFLKAL